MRVIRTPFRTPNCNAYAERFVRSIKEECPDGLMPLGEHDFRRALAEFVAHAMREESRGRRHQRMKEDSDQQTDLIRISGKACSEFPEPTPDGSRAVYGSNRRGRGGLELYQKWTAAQDQDELLATIKECRR